MGYIINSSYFTEDESYGFIPTAKFSLGCQNCRVTESYYQTNPYLGNDGKFKSAVNWLTHKLTSFSPLMYRLQLPSDYFTKLMTQC